MPRKKKKKSKQSNTETDVKHVTSISSVEAGNQKPSGIQLLNVITQQLSVEIFKQVPYV